MSDSLWPHGLQPARLLCPWNSPGKNTGVGCHALFQRIFPTQGSNLCFSFLLHWQVGSLPLDHLGSSRIKYQGNSTFFLEAKMFKLRKFNLLKQPKFPDGIFPISSYFWHSKFQSKRNKAKFLMVPFWYLRMSFLNARCHPTVQCSKAVYLSDQFDCY